MAADGRQVGQDQPDQGWVATLAQSVVEQVARFVPDGMYVMCEGTGEDLLIRIGSEHGVPNWTRFGFGPVASQEGDRPRIEYAELAVRVFLDNLQDFIVLHTKTPWPATGTTQPMPSAEIVGNRIEAWFGDDRDGLVYPTVSVEWEA